MEVVRGTNDVKPDSWLVWSILATIFCCLVPGIAGIVFAARVDNLWYAGHHDQAREAARKARLWTIVAVCCWLLMGLIYGVLMLLGISLGIIENMAHNVTGWH